LRRHIVAQAALPRLGGVVVNGGQRQAVSICVLGGKSIGVAREACSRRREHPRWKSEPAAGGGVDWRQGKGGIVNVQKTRLGVPTNGL
jgi:hypothetical protein